MALTTQENTAINNNITILKNSRRYDFYGDLDIALQPGGSLSRLGAFWDYVTLFDSSLGTGLNACIEDMNDTVTLLDGVTMLERLRERSSEVLSIPKPESYYYVIYKYGLNFPVHKYIFEHEMFYLFRLFHMDKNAYKLIYANPLNTNPEEYEAISVSDPEYKQYIDVPPSDLKEKYLKTLDFLQDCPPSTFRPTLIGNDEFNRLIGLAYNYIRNIDKTVNDWFKHVSIGKKILPTDTDLSHPGYLALFIDNLPEPDRTKCYCMARVLNAYFLTYGKHPLLTLTARNWSYIWGYHIPLNKYTEISNFKDFSANKVPSTQAEFLQLNAYNDEIYPNCPECYWGDPMEWVDFDGSCYGDVEGLRSDGTLSFKLYNQNPSLQNLFNLVLPNQEIKRLVNEEVKRLGTDSKVATWFPYKNPNILWGAFLNYYFFKFNSILTGSFEALSLGDCIYYLHYFWRSTYHTRISNKFNAFYAKRKRYYVDENIYFDLERRDLVKKVDSITDPLMTEDIKSYIKQIDTEEFIFLIFYGKLQSTYQTEATSPDGTAHSFPIPLSLSEFNSLVNSSQVIKSYIQGNIYSYSNDTQYFNTLLTNLETNENATYLVVLDCMPLFKQRVYELIDLYYAPYLNIDLYAQDKTENYYMLFESSSRPQEESFAIQGKNFFKVPEYTNQTIQGSYYDLASKMVIVVDDSASPRPFSIGDFSKYSFHENYLLIPTKYNTSMFKSCSYLVQFDISPLDYLKYSVRIVKVNKGVKEEYIKPLKGLTYKVVQNSVALKYKNNRAVYYYTPTN